jgi:hypothetical protein
MRYASIIIGLLLATSVIVAAKPVQPTASFTLAEGSETTFGGSVWFDVVGATPKMRIDVQCYGSVPGGTNNVGWWDTGPTDKVFVLGSQPTTAPPDLGSVIYLRWTHPMDMDCTARLFTVSRKDVVNVLDALSFPAM